jgi:hypothetical protein
MKPGFWERRRIRKSFEKFVSPEVIRLIEKDPKKFVDIGPRISHFQFVIILLDDSQPDNVPEILSRVADATLRHRSMISNISASIVVACLGVPFPDGDSVEERVRLVNTLVSENGALIRIAHGQCNGKVGNLGCEKRFAYEAVVPGFNAILRRLLDSPSGTVIEVSP